MDLPNIANVGSALPRISSVDASARFHSVADNDTAPPVSQTASEQKDVGASKKSVQEAASKVEKFVAMTNSEIKFSVDDDTGISVVKVIDTATDKVIRQLPSEEILAMARTLDKLQGLLFTGKA